MLGILILLILSYLILWFTKNHQHPFDYLPGSRSAWEMFWGLLWPIFYFCMYEFTIAFLVENPYVLSSTYNVEKFQKTMAYILRSVLFEELIFRGVLFYILFKRLGGKPTILISAACFGIYHWFAWNAFGSPVKMAIVFLNTASVGLVLGYAFLRTRSMYLPIALHLGANLSNMLLFSKDHAIGTQLLVKSLSVDGAVPSGFIGLPMLILHFIGFQLFTYLFIRVFTKVKSLK